MSSTNDHRIGSVTDPDTLRATLRSYLAEVKREHGLPASQHPSEAEATRRIFRILGRDGWLGIGWPKEYGGQGFSAREQNIFFEEIERAGFPFPFVTINTVGPAIMKHGTEEQRRHFLPRILDGTVNFAIGYTEPEAGTDLLGLKTRAELVDGEFRVDGSKIFTSGAHQADHIWLACRTDPEARGSRGISILITPTDQPGFSWSPIFTLGESVTAATFYDDVRVPEANLVGELHGGWRVITAQLNHERIALASLTGSAQQIWTEIRDEMAASPETRDSPRIRRQLAALYIRLRVGGLLNSEMFEAVDSGTVSPVEAAVAKIYTSEANHRSYLEMSQLMGPRGRLRRGSAHSVFDGRLERLARSSITNTFGGGSNEVLRDMVSTLGVGLPVQTRRAG